MQLFNSNVINNAFANLAMGYRTLPRSEAWLPVDIDSTAHQLKFTWTQVLFWVSANVLMALYTSHLAQLF